MIGGGKGKEDLRCYEIEKLKLVKTFTEYHSKGRRPEVLSTRTASRQWNLILFAYFSTIYHCI